MVWALILVLVLVLGLGPAPLVSLVLLWPVVAHLGYGAFYVAGVGGLTALLGKVESENAVLVVDDTRSAGRVDGRGEFDDGTRLPTTCVPNTCCGCCCFGCWCCRRGQGAQGGLLWLPSALFFAPAHLSQFAVWVLKHLLVFPCLGERPYDYVAEKIVVGRWPMRFPAEFPRECSGIVDLTAEWPARPDVLRGRRYVCCPTLDCTMPDPVHVLKAVEEVAKWPEGETTYIHCANGHGRSASFAAILMVVRGHAEGWRKAMEIMKKRRPHVGVHEPQAKVMDEVERMMRAKGLLGEGRAPRLDAEPGSRREEPVGRSV